MRLSAWYVLIRLVKVAVIVVYAAVTAAAILLWHFAKGLFRYTPRK